MNTPQPDLLRHTSPVRLPAVLLLVVPFGGCMVHEVDRDPPPPIEVPEAYSAGGTGELTDRWWQTLGDERLDGFVDTLVEGNLELRAAWSRIAAAQAVARASGAGLLPSVDASAGVSYSRSVFSFGGQSGDNEQARYSLSVAASYEVDLWGRVRSAEAAAEAEIVATREDLEATAMTLVAQAVDAWVLLMEQHQLRDLVKVQLETTETNLELIEARFQVGRAGAADIYQQRQQLASLNAQLPLIEARIATTKHLLAVLSGRPPTEDLVGELRALPEVPPLPSAGVPVALLERRPDVRAARLRVVAQDYRVGVAIADQYPKLGFSADAGFTSFDIVELFESFVFGLAANLVAPLFDGGRRSAEVDRNRAVLEQLVAAYGATLLTAFREVEDALVREAKQREYIERLSEQIDLAERTLEETRARYLQGATDYLPVIVTLRSLQGLEQSLVSAKRQLVSYRVQLHRALGGTWTKALQKPEYKASSKPAGEGESK